MTVEVRPSRDGWSIAHVGIEKAHRPTKQEAETVGRQLARSYGTELIIYREDMTVATMHQYPRNNGW